MTGRRRPAGDYDRGEMTALLEQGARAEGDTGYQAAIHLVTFTSLPGTRPFAGYVTVDTRTVRGRVIPVALIERDAWRPLVAGLRPTGETDYRFLTLAASLADGRLVSLAEALRNMGHAHARRIAEAVLIRAGAEQFYALAGTAELDRLRDLHRELSGG